MHGHFFTKPPAHPAPIIKGYVSRYFCGFNGEVHNSNPVANSSTKCNASWWLGVAHRLAEVSEITGKHVNTLTRWHKDETDLFRAIALG